VGSYPGPVLVAVNRYDPVPAAGSAAPRVLEAAAGGVPHPAQAATDTTRTEAPDAHRHGLDHSLTLGTGGSS